MSKYRNLQELIAAYGVELTQDDVLWLDNDEVSIFVDGKCVFRDYPEDLLMELLTFVGIPWEHV